MGSKFWGTGERPNQHFVRSPKNEIENFWMLVTAQPDYCVSQR